MKRSLFILMGLVAYFSFAPIVDAASLSDLTAVVSRQVVSAATDIQLKFTSPTGISDHSQTIVLTFASGFSLVGMTAGDVGLVHSPAGGPEVHATVAASAGAGVWGVSFVGQTIVLTPPTDAAPLEIAADEEITVLLGTGAGGTHQITTPSSPGVYEIAISGVFGDIGALRVPITAASASGIGVSFVIPSRGGSSPGGGGSGGSTVPLPIPPAPDAISITGFATSEITQTSTRIAWNTGVPASCVLTVQNNGVVTATISTASGVTHAVSVSGLSPSVSYNASVSCSALGSSPGVAGPMFWSTLPLVVLENVSDLRATRDDATASPLHLTWVPPTTLLPGDEIIVREKNTSYPWGPTDGRAVVVSGSGAADDPGRGTAFYAVYVRRGPLFSSGAMVMVEAIPTIPVPAPVPVPVPAPVPAPVPTPAPRPTPIPSPTVPGHSTGGTVPASGGTAPVPTATVPELPVVVPLMPTSPELGTPSSTPSGATISLIIPEPTSTAPTMFSIDWQWRLQESELVLVEGSRAPRVLVGDGVQVIIKGTQPIVSGQIRVNGSTYALSRLDDRRFVVAFAPGKVAGTVEAIATVRNALGQEKTITTSIVLVEPFQVREKNDATQPSSGSEVQILVKKGKSWSLVPGTKRVLEDSGVYRQYLSPGTYRLEASKAGWRTIQQAITLTDAGPVTGMIVLDKSIENPLAAIDPDAGALENAGNVVAATVTAVAQAIENIRTPEAEAVAQVAAPVAVIATASATAAAASSFNILAYLRFLFTQPLLLLRRRKREKWGLVYNALTKQPIDLAIVRLLDAKTGVLKQTRITDAQGRYAFLAEAGSYVIQVVKPGFVFPSATLAQEKIDIDFVDLYHGEGLRVEASATLTPNIPVDPMEKVEVPKAILRKKQIRTAQHILGGFGLVVAMIAFVIQPTVLMGLFTLGQVVAFFLFRRLAVPRKPKNWGIVYDQRTRKPIERVVVRIFDKKYNKLLETQLTDRDGKYAFFAGKNIYYVTADAFGYERFTSKDLDLRNESMGVVREHLSLEKKTPVPSPMTA